MKLQTVSRGVESLCAGLLPTLAEAACVEYVAFLKSRDIAEKRVWDTIFECPAGGEAANIPSLMETLMDHFPIRNSQKGFVFNRNGLNSPLEARLKPEIRSCLAVEVQNGESSIDLKGSVSAQGLPTSQKELRQQMQSFLQRLVHWAKHVRSYFLHPSVYYASSA